MQDIIGFIADGTLLIVVVAGCLALLVGVPRDRAVRDYSYVTMAGLTALLIAKLASLLYQPAHSRPFIELGLQPGAKFIDNPGFPSDHMLLGSAIVLAMYAITPYKKTALVVGGIVVVMGVGRVLALVHTPLDIVGGAVAALLGGLWYVVRYRQIK